MTSLIATATRPTLLPPPASQLDPLPSKVVSLTAMTSTQKRPRSFWDTVLDASSNSQTTVATEATIPTSLKLDRPGPSSPDITSHVRDVSTVLSSPVSDFTDTSAQLKIPSPTVPSLRSSPIELPVSRVIHKTQTTALTNRPHVCSTCGSSFARSSHLRLHIRTIHEKLKPFQCEQCPAAFGHVSSKYRHFRTVHLKRRDFACDRCGQTFAERAAVLKHCRTVHEGSRPYPCPTCGFRFHFKLHLSQHISTVHEKQRPHQCMICNACFGQRSSLNRHSRQIHGVSTKK